MTQETIKTKKEPKKTASKNEQNLLIKVLANRVLFAVHLFAYIAVSGLLVLLWGINASLSGDLFFWPVFTMLGWGIGIGFHTITYLMFNDKVEYLTRVRKESTFGILYIYHLFFYAIVNALIFIANLLITPGIIYFYWPLAMWGIGFGFHTLGFLTWDQFTEKESQKLKQKNPEAESKKIQMDAQSKIVNLWVLLAHISYFIVANILIYINVPATQIQTEPFTLIESTLTWATVLGIHVFGYYLFFYNDKFPKVLKGLILHITFYIGINAWIIYSDLTQLPEMVTFYYPLILWGVAILVHTFLYLKWDSIQPAAIEETKRNLSGEYDKYELNKKANRLLFWKWSFISHLLIWALGIVLIGINFAIEGINMQFLVIAALGWLIGVSVHGGCFIVVLKNISDFLSWTATLHLSAYISTAVLLITLNVMAPAFPWSAIALAGWGIGLGIHILLAKLT
ncbi:MAG: 2TM domain-containing protein [Promethearchaeota archaeon]|nr:MAG: 2TM domain-containing protein [Candidatus Lokiarchaeota archaeon]